MDGFAAYEGLFLGRDPGQITRHVRTLETIGFHASRYWPLEAALWDIALMNVTLFGKGPAKKPEIVTYFCEGTPPNSRSGYR
jgi:hypothetical protein